MAPFGAQLVVARDLPDDYYVATRWVRDDGYHVIIVLPAPWRGARSKPPPLVSSSWVPDTCPVRVLRGRRGECDALDLLLEGCGW